MLSPRQLIPPLTIHTSEGRTVHAWDFKQKKNLVIAFLHADCPACREFLARLAIAGREFAEREAIALIVLLETPSRTLAEGLPAEIVLGTDVSGRSVRNFLGKDALSSQGLEELGVFVTDRYGEVFAQWAVSDHNQLPGITEILSWLGHIEIACEECGVPYWPSEG
jgi:AhpC/TSA family